MRRTTASLGATLNCSKGSGMGMLCDTPSRGSGVSRRIGVLSRRLTHCPSIVTVSDMSTDTYSIRFSLTVRGKVPVMTFSSKGDCRGVRDAYGAGGVRTMAAKAGGFYRGVNSDKRVLLLIRSAMSSATGRHRTRVGGRLTTGRPGIAIARAVCLSRLRVLGGRVITRRMKMAPRRLTTTRTKRGGRRAAKANSTSRAVTSTTSGTTSSSTSRDTGRATRRTSGRLSRGVRRIGSNTTGVDSRSTVRCCVRGRPSLGKYVTAGRAMARLTVEALSRFSSRGRVALMKFSTKGRRIGTLGSKGISKLVIRGPFKVKCTAMITTTHAILRVKGRTRIGAKCI